MSSLTLADVVLCDINEELERMSAPVVVDIITFMQPPFQDAMECEWRNTHTLLRGVMVGTLLDSADDRREWCHDVALALEAAAAVA